MSDVWSSTPPVDGSNHGSQNPWNSATQLPEVMSETCGWKGVDPVLRPSRAVDNYTDVTTTPNSRHGCRSPYVLLESTEYTKSLGPSQVNRGPQASCVITCRC